jgi:L-ascorbate metabolism protein UlaG (beta-lactamase superfamily)
MIGLAAMICGWGALAMEEDRIPVSGGEVEVGFVGHGSLFFRYQGKVIHVDPFGKMADYSKLPKADLILITHEHLDHLDPAAIAQIRRKETRIVVNAAGLPKLDSGIVMRNGDTQSFWGVRVEAVPAYNLHGKRPDGEPFHPKGVGNGYLLAFGARRFYVAGDT